VKQDFSKYDLKERISLLELAVWKCVCQLSKEASASCNALEWHLWSVLGWKLAKKEMRHSNSIAITIGHVKEFLVIEHRSIPSLPTNIW
jgi:hypothetical protein